MTSETRAANPFQDLRVSILSGTKRCPGGHYLEDVPQGENLR